MILSLKTTSTDITERTTFNQYVTQTFINESTNIEYKGEFKENFNYNEETLRTTVERKLLKFYIKENNNFTLLDNVNDTNVIDHHCGECYCHITLDI